MNSALQPVVLCFDEKRSIEKSSDKRQKYHDYV